VATAHLILGGARSGKSRFAVAAHASARRVAFVATAQARDGELAARIARHRAERPPQWTTVEEPYDLAAALARLAGERLDAVIVDCLTVWAGNRLLRGDADDSTLAEAERLAAVIARRAWDLTVITNEVGEGVHPSTAEGLRFRDLLGLVNQRIAAACDRVTLMVAGVPLTIKAPALRHDLAPQAP
jgi:adenosylcobinamide kinase/adenosylcobinamide-phosphate guanylyltransferase